MTDNEVYHDARLKRCPFCGSWATIGNEFSTDESFKPAMKYFVRCDNKYCRANISAFDEAACVEKWNKRDQ